MSKTFLVLLFVAGLIGAGVLMVRSARQERLSSDFPDGMHWVCAECQHGFSIPREEFAEWAADHDERLPCPECGKNTTEVAQRCPLQDCGKYHIERNVVIDGKVCCPVCRGPLP